MGPFLNKKLWFIFLPLLLCISCLVGGKKGYRGEVYDAETGEGLKEVIVFREMVLECPRFSAAGNVKYKQLPSSETKSDDNGHFSLPFKVYPKSPECTSRARYFFYKPGYFLKQLNSEEKKICLIRMRHYLDFLRFRHPCEYYPGYNYAKNFDCYQKEVYRLQLNGIFKIPDRFRKKSKLLTQALKKTAGFRFNTLDRPGVYERRKGYRFISLLNISMKNMLFAYDTGRNHWVKIDDRGTGNMTPVHNLPPATYINKRLGENSLYSFAKDDVIYYPKKDIHNLFQYMFDKDHFHTLTPHIGKIIAFASTFLQCMTIEDNGAMVCHYGNKGTEQNYYKKQSPDVPSSMTIYLLKVFTPKDLPISAEDDTLDTTRFCFLIAPVHNDFYIISRTDKYWHLYRFSSVYGDGKLLKEIAHFPLYPEIVAAARGNGLYLAFKGGTLRRYMFREGSMEKFKEDNTFFENSRRILNADATALIFNGYLYAITGGDSVYRFSQLGIPDHQVEIDAGRQGEVAEVWSRHTNISKTPLFEKKLIHEKNGVKVYSGPPASSPSSRSQKQVKVKKIPKKDESKNKY